VFFPDSLQKVFAAKFPLRSASIAEKFLPRLSPPRNKFITFPWSQYFVLERNIDAAHLGFGAFAMESEVRAFDLVCRSIFERGSRAIATVTS
jgi:hypothetical protein